MSPMPMIRSRAATVRRRLILPEPQDPRVLFAAREARSFADLVLIGNVDAIHRSLKADAKLQASMGGVYVVDPASQAVRSSGLLERLSRRLFSRRGGKELASFEEAVAKTKSSPLYFGNLLVAENFAHGQVAGSLATTGDVVKAALHCVGTGAGVKTASSFMLMVPPQGAAVIFSDCGFVMEPNAEQLADIALSAALSARSLLSNARSATAVKVALLSFSTKGSAEHPSVTKVRQATELLKQRLQTAGLEGEVEVDGELQFDAAFVPKVAERKAPESTVAGRANVFIFPDLNAGNIAYKVAERIGGWKAVGPILQGFAKPSNDLSRGCTPEDIVDALAITALQAVSSATLEDIGEVGVRL